MRFEWSQYLTVAKELAGQATTPANQEVKLRAAISRAYNAAFIKARNHPRDKQRYSIPTTGDADKYVSEQCELSVDPVDKFPGLSGITLTALRLSSEVISTLNSL